MNRFRFIEKGLCCDVYYDKDRLKDKCALFLYGFPATIGSNSMTDILVDEGYMVLHPHYYGTYDSDGDFSPDSAVQTVENIVDIVHNSTVVNLKNNKPINIPPNISVCIGYSFGAYVIRRSISYLSDLRNNLKTIILASPVMSNNPTNELCWVNEDGEKHLDYVCRTRPFTYRIHDRKIWDEKYVNDKSVSCGSKNNSIENVLWLYGKQDPAMIEKNLNKLYLTATKQCISEKAKTTIIGVPEGNHSINSLITNSTKNVILSVV